MIKKMLLYFLCLFLFLSISGCKLPTTPVVLPKIMSFTANPSMVMLNDSSILSWSTINATIVTIDHRIGSVTITGIIEISPEETTTYTLTAINNDGQISRSCAVEVKK